jgi:Barrel-sandwich domain of CusB or HlyD membrane-fusion
MVQDLIEECRLLGMADTELQELYLAAVASAPNLDFWSNMPGATPDGWREKHRTHSAFNLRTYAGVTLDFSNVFTLADHSRVWTICAIYENDLTSVDLDQKAEIRLVVYLSKVLTGVISYVDAMLLGGKHVIKSGLDIGHRVVSNALTPLNTVDQ